MRGWWWVAAVAAVLLLAGGTITAVALRGRPAGEPTASRPVADPATNGTVGSPLPSASASPTTAATATASPSPTSPPTAAAPVPTTKAPAPTAAPGAASLAGRIKPHVVYDGVATWYDSDGGGACLYDSGGDPMTAAMNWSDYEGSKACGAYVLVRASTGATVTVRITNECPAPCRVHQLDLSPQAFAKLADPSTGQLSVTWQLVSPEISGGISVRYKTGSSQYWCAIQVINHRNPVAVLEVRAGSTWRELSRTDYNYFLSADGSGCGGAVRVTDIYGQRLALPAFSVQPDVVQATDLQFARH